MGKYFSQTFRPFISDAYKPGKVHIGQTGRTLEHGLKEHKRALTSGNVSQSTIAEHAMAESHTIKWEEAEVVGHLRYRQRCQKTAKLRSSGVKCQTIYIDYPPRNVQKHTSQN